MAKSPSKPSSSKTNKRKAPEPRYEVDANGIKIKEKTVADADNSSETDDAVDPTQDGDGLVNHRHLSTPPAQRSASTAAARNISSQFSPKKGAKTPKLGPRIVQGKPPTGEVPLKPRYDQQPHPKDGWSAWAGQTLWTMQHHLEEISSVVQEMHSVMQRTTEQHIDLTSKLEDITQLAESKPRVVEEVKKEGGLDQDKVDHLVSLALSHHTAWPNWGKSVFWHAEMDKSFGEGARNAATISVPKRWSFLRLKDRLTFLFGRH